MDIKKFSKKVISLCLVASLMIPMAACSDDEKKDNGPEYKGKKNATVSSESKWVNSSIDGAIDHNLKTNLKDDFYSYVNKDWIVKAKLGKDKEAKSLFTDCENLVKKRQISIISGEKDPDANETADIKIAEKELEHNAQLLQDFTEKAADWEQRNQLGVKALQDHIDKIASISTMDEMSSYIVDLEGDNISGKSFVDVNCDQDGLLDTKNYQVQMGPTHFYLLKNQDDYNNIFSSKADVIQDMDHVEKMARAVLKECGYTKKEVASILRQAYHLECLLVDHMEDSSMELTQNYIDRMKEKTYSLDALDQMAGTYPLKEYVQALHGDKIKKFHCCETDYLKGIAKVYTESNLEKIKDYYIITSIIQTADLLDRASYDRVQEYLGQEKKEAAKDGDGDQTEKEIKDDWDLILQEFVGKYLAGPLDTIYISRYCNSQQKAELTHLVDTIVYHYKKMIDKEKWLSQTARKKTKEKLEHIKINVLYPNQFDSYMGIQFDKQDSLITMVQKINLDKKRKEMEIVGDKVDNTKWDLATNPTTVANAYYMPSHNSINILAGIIASGDCYREDMSREDLYARIGTIVGHEISHAFDQTGCDFDKNGNYKTWWKMDDVVAFQLRNNKVTQYFDTLQGYPGSGDLNGDSVAGEAVADMGGMKVCLEIAKSMKGFDYDKYFTSYAKMWRSREAFSEAEAQFSSDPHPLNFLRVNVTLMQYDEFVKTYDIKKGDGMYMAPKKRIAVW